MDDIGYKEVDFTKCEICAHKNKKDYEDPCNDCLDVCAREGTSKPLYFKGVDDERN